MTTTTTAPCGPDETLVGYEGRDSLPVCLPVETLPALVLPEPAAPTPTVAGDAATCTPFPACKYDAATAPTTDAATDTTPTTVPPATPAVVDTARPTAADVLAGPVLLLVLLLVLVAVLVAAAVVAVRRDVSTRAAWGVVALGCRRIGWPLGWAWRRKHVRARLLLGGAVVVGYVLVLLFAADAIGALLTFALVAVAVELAGDGIGVLRRSVTGPPEPPAWWSERVLVGALRTAGVLPRAKTDAPPVTLRRFGQPQHDEHGGTAVKLGLPPGVTASSLAARREGLAAALGVPVALLEVRSDPAESPNVVTLAVFASRPTGTAASPLATAASTRSEQPVRIGTDPRGRAVCLATAEENVLVAGRPGAGKTTTARVVLAHYLLDPTADVFLLDGKGSTRDYGAARALCARYVSGADEDAVPATLELLEDVLRIVRERNSASGDGTVPGGLLVLLEELQDVRAAADKATREQLDAVLGRIVRMGRAVGVTVLVSTQRPSVDDLPSGVRNLISQRLALMLRNGSDAALVLGHTPELPLPAQRGQALLTTASGCTAVTLDHLTDDAWRAVCARAAVLRPAAPPPAPAPASAPPAAAEVAPDVAAEPDPQPVRDPLVHAVVEVLRDSDPRGLPATALLGLLPGWLAPATPALLGRALGKAPEVQRGHVGKSPVWRLAGALGDPSVRPRSTPRTEGAEGSVQGETPGQPPAGGAPSVPSAPTAGGAS